MMKYIFFISLGLFLMLGVSSVPNKDLQGVRSTIGTIATESLSHASKISIQEVCKKDYQLKEDSHYGRYSYETGDGVLANSLLSRSYFTPKTLKITPSSAVIQILSAFKTQLPEEKWTAFSYEINPLKYSYRYYIYTLGRMLI
ncbi:hypothetical protein [Bacteroides reticulotermitis]|nr:hypothetical protein [Bacteroides reticulotermitis]HJD77165.1 hypothetical protein [Bacteroides reticulotermitis]